MAKYLEDCSGDTLFVSGSLESLLPEHSVARTIWRALGEVDFRCFDVRYCNDASGRPAIDPRRRLAVHLPPFLEDPLRGDDDRIGIRRRVTWKQDPEPRMSGNHISRSQPSSNVDNPRS